MDAKYTQKLDAFLKSHNFRTDDEYFFSLTKYFEKMLLSYSSRKESGFMIDTKIFKPYHNIKDQKVVVIDVGGTNVRRSVVCFDKNGKPSLSELDKIPFNELFKHKGFFESLASFITPLLEKIEDISKIALCFSFPFVLEDDGDAIVKGNAKGLNTEELKGKRILENLKKEIEKTIKKDLRLSIVNDATSLLLYLSIAEKSKDSIFVASIVGTGTNVALYQKEDVKAKAICTEIGHFDMSEVRFSDFDYIVDKNSEHPSSSVVEILTSGFYLHKVFKEMLKTALIEKVFEEDDQKLIENYLNTLNETKDIDKIFTFKGGVAYLADKFVSRAAATVASFLKASYEYSKKSLETESNKVSILIEGSTYYLLPTYKEKTEDRLKKYFAPIEPCIYYPQDNKGTVVLYGASLSSFQ